MGSYQDEVKDLQAAGFSEDEIQQDQVKQRQDMAQAGFSNDEIDQHFGAPKKPDMAPMKNLIDKNLQKVTGIEKGNPSTNSSQSLPGPAPIPTGTPAPQGSPAPATNATHPDDPPMREAKDFIDAIEAGFEISVTGLLGRSKRPDVILPEDAPTAYRIASQMSTLAGDLPVMIAGSMIGTAAGGAAGGALGSAVPAVGNAAGAAAGAVVGGGAGAMALPTAIRSVLMQHYEKGDIQDFQDFWERSSAVFLDTMKSAVVGGATAGAGSAVKAFAPIAQPLVKTTAQLASEIGTMVTIGKALEGQAPKAQDFIDAAILVGGMHGANVAGEMIAGKIRNIYAKTGIKPEQVAEHAQIEPTVQQDLLSSNKGIPSAYEGFIQGDVEEGPKPVPLEAGKAMEETSNVLGPESGEEKSQILLPAPKEEAPPEPPPKPEVPPVEPGEKPTPEQAQQAILDRIGTPEKKGFLKDLTWDKLYTATMDDLHPLKLFTDSLAGEKRLPTKDDPYALARLTRGTFGKVDQMLERGPFDFKTLEDTGTPGLKQILKPVQKDLDGFRAFAIASRALELEARGLETGIPMEEAKTVVEAGKAKYGPVLEKTVQFQNDILSYLADSGVLSMKAYRDMTEANKNYVPFYRVLEEGRISQESLAKGFDVKNPFREFKGSERQIVDPIESMIKNAYFYVSLAERNRVTSSMVDLAGKAGEAGEALMKKVPMPLTSYEVKNEEINHFLRALGMEETDESFDIFRRQLVDLKANEVVAFKDGKRSVYQVDPDVAKALSAMDRDSANMLTRILAKPAQALRAGAVLTPDFMARHMIRGQLMGYLFSENGFVPFYDTLRGLGGVLREDQDYQNWLKSGGANSASVSIDRDYIQNNVFKLNEETGFLNSAHNILKSPLEVLRASAELMENSTRLGEFKRAASGATDAATIIDAGMGSRDVSLDYARIGAQTRAINMVTAFWNAGVQGMDKTVRAFIDRPAESALKVGASITLPSVLLWWANHDDPRWQEIPRWEKDLFWIVMTKDHIYRIPKPFEAGVIFGSLPERTLEAYFTDNPKAYSNFNETMLHGITPNFIPTAATPFIETWANRSTFTGHSIVPAPLEKVAPEFQYNEYTSESGKMLSRFVAAVPPLKDTKAASPMVIENFVRSWSGNLGMYALSTADKALELSGVTPPKIKPDSTLSDLPFVKAFAIRYPSGSAQSIQDFHDNFKKAQVEINTIHNLAGRGDFESAQKVMRLGMEDGTLMNLQGIEKSLGVQSAYIQKIMANPQLTSTEKRQQIDGVYYQMIEASKLGNKMVQEVQNSLKH